MHCHVAREFYGGACHVAHGQVEGGVTLTLSGHEVKCFSLGVGSSKRVLEVFVHLTKNTSEFFSTIEIKRQGAAAKASTGTMEEAFRLTEHLTNGELAQAAGNAKLVDPNARTDLLKVLCRCESQLH